MDFEESKGNTFNMITQSTAINCERLFFLYTYNTKHLQHQITQTRMVLVIDTHTSELTLIPAWISNHIHHQVWGEVTYPFLNFNGAAVEV